MTRKQAIAKGQTLKKIFKEIEVRNSLAQHYKKIYLNIENDLINIRSPVNSNHYYEISIPCDLNLIDVSRLKQLHKLVKGVK